MDKGRGGRGSTEVEKKNKREKTYKLSESGNRTPGYPAHIKQYLMRADNVSHYTNSDWLKEQNLTGPILCGERKHKPPRFIRSNLHNRLGTNKLYIQAHTSNTFVVNSVEFLLYLLVPNSYRNDQLPIERQYGANRGNLSWKVGLATH